MSSTYWLFFFFFFFNDTATTEIYTLSDTLSLHDALPILDARLGPAGGSAPLPPLEHPRSEEHTSELQSPLNISYAVFCLKKKKKKQKKNNCYKTYIKTSNKKKKLKKVK